MEEFRRRIRIYQSKRKPLLEEEVKFEEIAAYNVVSKETLLDAKKHPEKYRDLIVRGAGYSDYFTVRACCSR